MALTGMVHPNVTRYILMHLPLREAPVWAWLYVPVNIMSVFHLQAASMKRLCDRPVCANVLSVPQAESQAAPVRFEEDGTLVESTQ